MHGMPAALAPPVTWHNTRWKFVTQNTKALMGRMKHLPPAAALARITETKSVARAIFDEVENGDEDIFPDPMSASMADGWRSGAAKALERQLAALASTVPAA